ncbi:MAG TPA: WYL domain-containing protein, partial [Pirellulaceae bacterium]|nr:WYL domain-containing protein [Pirellulaceae bacterium]
RKYRRTLRVLGVPTKNYERQHGIIKTLNRGILEHRRVDVVYHSIGSPPKRRLIEPYTIALFQSSLYIVAAACEDDNPETRVRSWKLDRFEKADITDERFEFPDDLTIEEFVGGGMGMFIGRRPQNYRIRVSPQAARWVQEDPWHPEQQIKTLKDGSVELSVQAAHELDIIPRVLQLGTEAEILAPASARERMAQIVSQLSKLYS